MEEKLTVISTEVPKEWADALKAEAKSKMPKTTRKAVLFKVIERHIKRMKSKGRC